MIRGVLAIIAASIIWCVGLIYGASQAHAMNSSHHHRPDQCQSLVLPLWAICATDWAQGARWEYVGRLGDRSLAWHQCWMLLGDTSLITCAEGTQSS